MERTTVYWDKLRHLIKIFSPSAFYSDRKYAPPISSFTDHVVFQWNLFRCILVLGNGPIELVEAHVVKELHDTMICQTLCSGRSSGQPYRLL
jgi:hypothetical protein